MHFQSFFREDRLSDDEITFEVLSNIPSLVSAKVNGYLLKPFLEKEIIEVIWSMKLGNAPGPDEFSIHF